MGIKHPGTKNVRESTAIVHLFVSDSNHSRMATEQLLDYFNRVLPLTRQNRPLWSVRSMNEPSNDGSSSCRKGTSAPHNTFVVEGCSAQKLIDEKARSTTCNLPSRTGGSATSAASTPNNRAGSISWPWKTLPSCRSGNRINSICSRTTPNSTGSSGCSRKMPWWPPSAGSCRTSAPRPRNGISIFLGALPRVLQPDLQCADRLVSRVTLEFLSTIRRSLPDRHRHDDSDLSKIKQERRSLTSGQVSTLIGQGKPLCDWISCLARLNRRRGSAL